MIIKNSEPVSRMGHSVLPLLAAMACLLLYGCALHRPEGVTEIEFWSRFKPQQTAWHLYTQSEGGVEVAVAIPDREQTQVLFGAPLWDRGIQPVWLRIRNEGDIPY
jgi:hypothetical protein